MNSGVNIVPVVENLAEGPIVLDAQRCVVVRHRRSTCTACIDACPVAAISQGDNSVLIDRTICMGCGACTVQCPTEAIRLTDLSEKKLEALARAAQEKAAGMAVLACKAAGSCGVGAPEAFASVPCLARVGEELLCQLAACGSGKVVLVDDGCENCAFGACERAIDETVTVANRLLALRGLETPISRSRTFPPQARLDEAGFDRARRGFFVDVKSLAHDAAQSAVVQALPKPAVGDGTLDQSLYERLRPTAAGTLPTLAIRSRTQVLDALDTLGVPSAATLDVRHFATVSIDAEKCNGCGLCSLFCPTAALKRMREGVMEFSACECVGCGVCADACIQGCVAVAPGARDADVFDFEPTTIVIPVADVQRDSVGSVARKFLTHQLV